MGTLSFILGIFLYAQPSKADTFQNNPVYQELREIKKELKGIKEDVEDIKKFVKKNEKNVEMVADFVRGVAIGYGLGILGILIIVVYRKVKSSKDSKKKDAD